jgi:transcriptional regulator with XRE-family HTH domain
MADRPLSHWMTLARLGFEEDLARLMNKKKILKSDLAKNAEVSPPFITKVLSGANNYTLKTMTKLARAVGAVLEVRLADESGEVVRVVDYETARQLDAPHVSSDSAREEYYSVAPIVYMKDYLAAGGSGQVKRKSLGSASTPSDGLAANHG